MKKFISAISILLFSAMAANAATGDTTWIQAQTEAWLGTVPTNTDSTIQFPDGSKSYRKILMIFTLGKYACPGSPQYCSDWDYTVQNFLMTPDGDTLELGRLITPYANSARMPASWKQRYVFDVTDMYPVLKDYATVRIHYSGWSGGFTGTVQFAFIEGIPPRNVLGIERLWHGGFTYGDGADPIDNKVTAISATAPANTVSTEMKLNITGHGGDGTSNCAEFCKKYYQVEVNGNMIAQKDIWRDDCGSNHIYPQNGTWVYNRGNWCPGDLVFTNIHDLGITSATQYDVDIDFESYTGSGNLGSYIVEAAAYYYAGFNKSLDASLDDVIAPNNHETHYRQNPATPNPVIRVKNTGSTAITSLDISYGANGPMNTHNWTGTIQPLEEAVITLPEIWELRSATGNANTFTATIAKVNGQDDGDNTNNSLTTTFTAAPLWPTEFYITLKTNGSMAGGVSETGWRIWQNGNVVAERINNDPTTTYVDTVRLGPAAYQLQVIDDGCDGVNWWAYQFYNPNPGTGFINVKRVSNNSSLPLTGYFNGDFGCGLTQQFNVDWPASVEDAQVKGYMGITVYPNPASATATVMFENIADIDASFVVLDAVGRTVLMQKADKPIQDINVSELANGVYSVVYTSGKANLRLQSRLVVAK